MTFKFMKFGIVPREWADFVKESVEQCLLAKQMGFSSIWIEEHHANEYNLPYFLLRDKIIVYESYQS